MKSTSSSFVRWIPLSVCEPEWNDRSLAAGLDLWRFSFEAKHPESRGNESRRKGLKSSASWGVAFKSSSNVGFGEEAEIKSRSFIKNEIFQEIFWEKKCPFYIKIYTNWKKTKFLNSPKPLTLPMILDHAHVWDHFSPAYYIFEKVVRKLVRLDKVQ